MTEKNISLDNYPNQKSFAYRCRLKGIAKQTQIESVDESNSRGFKKPRHKVEIDAHINIIRRIEKLDGWVLCEICEIDVYKRLLVNIVDIINKEDFRDHILNNYSQCYSQY
jgi:hypothetical protein